jgi:sporulation protein YlmC with PRC-barrel domain
MRTSFQELKNSEVYTKSGVYLGKVRDIVLDLDHHSVAQYLVKKFPLWFPESDKYLINSGQIEAFKQDVIIVKDARLQDDNSASNTDAKPNPAVMSDSSS